MSHTEDAFLVPMVLGKREGDRVRNPIPSHPQLTCLHLTLEVFVGGRRETLVSLAFCRGP